MQTKLIIRPGQNQPVGRFYDHYFRGIKNPAKYSVFYMCRLIKVRGIKISHEHIDYKWNDFEEIEKIPWHNINSKLAVKKQNKC